MKQIALYLASIAVEYCCYAVIFGSIAIAWGITP